MDISSLKPGDKVRTAEGSLAEVLKPTQDGQWILVRYLEIRNPNLIGTEDLCQRTS